MTSHVIAVFGLSGVGKTWMISRFCSANSVLHLQASQLLRDTKAVSTSVSASSEQLRTGPVLNNQFVLVQAFESRRATTTAPIIFDGHCVVDTDKGLIEIPSSVIRSLQVSAMIFVSASPDKIVARRLADTTRTRPLRTTDEIDAQQKQALAVCKRYAAKLGISLTIVAAGDEKAFASAITSALMIDLTHRH